MYTDNGTPNIQPGPPIEITFEEQVEILKRKHPGAKLYLIDVECESSEARFVLKQPDRKIMAAVAKLAHADPFQSTVVLVENCLVFGDKNLLDDVSIFSAVAEKFETVLQSRKATIKNL